MSAPALRRAVTTAASGPCSSSGETWLPARVVLHVEDVLHADRDAEEGRPAFRRRVALEQRRGIPAQARKAIGLGNKGLDERLHLLKTSLQMVHVI